VSLVPEGLYERVLAAGGSELVAVRPPRPSAAVIPWRRDRGALEVYWIRRGRRLPFMAGWHAFPGGVVDRADAALPLAGRPRHERPGAPTSPAPEVALPDDPDLAPGVAAAALRELWEEVGLLVVARERPADAALARARIPAGVPLGETLLATGLRLDAARLRFAGRWLTPPFAPVRFDNRFFLLEWRPEDGEPAVQSDESESGEWIAPGVALARLAAGPAMAAPPILHLLRVLAEEGPEGPPDRLLDTREANLGPLRRIELRPGMLLFPLAAATLPPASHTNALLLGRADCVLVDPGSPFEPENERLLAALAVARERLGRRVVAIWLTHHHPDHVAGVEPLRRALGVPVAAHPLTAERLRARDLAIDAELADDQVVVLAGDPPLRLRVHSTPGHARGHLAIEVEGPGDLVGGDLVAGVGTVVIDPPEGDMDDYLHSLERMRRRELRTLFPAHGAPILDVAGKLDEQIAHRLERERQILAGWGRGLRTPEALVAEVYADVPPALRPLAARQALAHLERLRKRGRIDAGASFAVPGKR
jgi:endoribonuclease LACTB2